MILKGNQCLSVNFGVGVKHRHTSNLPLSDIQTMIYIIKMKSEWSVQLMSRYHHVTFSKQK